MPKITPEIKLQIQSLSKHELEKLVLIAAGKDKNFHDYLLINYIDKEYGEKDLFEKVKADLDILFCKSYKGFSEELQLANMISACVKRINLFSKVCKKKNLEVDLLMYVLEIPFSLTTNMFGTCFTKYDYKVGLLVKRVITLIEKKLHPDYKIEYQEKVNQYLTILHRTSKHIDFIYNMPKYI